MNAPQTASEAAAQLFELGKKLDGRRRTAARLRNALDDAEALYKGQKWRALAGGVEGRNAEEREAHAMLVELSPDVKLEAAKVAERAGIAGWMPGSIDDLRWLRDRAEGIAEAAAAAAYDTRDELRAWQSVASWSRSEFEQITRGPAEAVPA